MNYHLRPAACERASCVHCHALGADAHPGGGFG